MKNLLNRSMLVVCMVVFMTAVVTDFAGAEGLLKRNEGPSDLQRQELDDAYYRGYNDAKSGKEAVEYSAGEPQRNGEVARGAGRGALGGAAVGSLSGGEAGKGAAWGAGAGAVKGAIKRRRAAEEEKTWAAELSDAYNKGYRKGMAEAAGASAKKPAQEQK